MKNQSINLAYNAQAQKFYIVINNVDSDDPIKTALTALIQGIAGTAEVKPVEGLELTKTNADNENVVSEETANTEENASGGVNAEKSASESTAAENATEEASKVTAEVANPAANEEKSDSAGESMSNGTAEVPFPEILLDNDGSVSVEDEQPENKQEEPKQEEAVQAAVFKLKPGVRCVGAIVKKGAATLNRKDGTIVTTDLQAINELEKAGLERIEA